MQKIGIYNFLVCDPDITLVPSIVERRLVSGGRNKVAPSFTFILPDMVSDAGKEQVRSTIRFLVSVGFWLACQCQTFLYPILHIRVKNHCDH